MPSTRKQEILGAQLTTTNPGSNGLACRLGNLELHRSLSFLLHNNGACRDPLAVRNITNANFHEIASAQLAIDREIEQRKITGTVSNLQAHSNGPDVFELQRRFLPDELSFVPWFTGWTNASGRFHERLLFAKEEP